jgi:hypothetical protein
MTGANCDLFTHSQSRSYLNHLVTSFVAVPFLTFNCLVHIANASSSLFMFHNFRLSVSTFVRFFNLFFSLSISPLGHPLMGVSNNKEK